MLEFREETDLKKFDEFVGRKKGSFIQCSRWPKIKTYWKPYFFAGFRNGEQVLSCLVLERSLSVCGKIWYVPDGPLTDYSDPEILSGFTSFIKDELKKHSITALLTDPHVALRIDHELCDDGVKLHEELIKLGYILNFDVARYIYKSPIQYMISLKKEDGTPYTEKELLKNCEKGVRYSVRIGESRGLVCKNFTYKDIESDPKILDDFSTVMRATSDRDDFIEKKPEYVKNLMKVFEDCMTLSLVYYDKNFDRQFENERSKTLSENLKKLENTDKTSVINRLTNENETIKQQSENYQKRVKIADGYTSEDIFVVAGGLTVRFGVVASCLFGGSIDVLRNETRSSHFVNYRRICDSIEQGCDFHDLGYVLVDNPSIPSDKTQIMGELTPFKNFEGINSFKASLGAKLYQFEGEYVLVNNKLRYFIYSRLVPLVKKVKIKIMRFIRKVK